MAEVKKITLVINLPSFNNRGVNEHRNPEVLVTTLVLHHPAYETEQWTQSHLREGSGNWRSAREKVKVLICLIFMHINAWALKESSSGWF